MKRYFRSRSRVLGAIGQPILFLLALGYGIGAVYKKAGQGNYLEFLVPGIIVQTLLFSGVFWGIQILFDKRFGFLKEMLVAPVSRTRILLGNALGGSTISLIQAALVLVISIGLGFRPYNWALLPVAFLIMMVLSVTLTSFGAGIAVFCAGLAMAPVFPTTLAMVGDAFPRATATAMGIAITSGWIGLMVSSRIIGGIAGADPTRLKTALLVIPIFSVLMVIVNLIVRPLMKRRQTLAA